MANISGHLDIRRGKKEEYENKTVERGSEANGRALAQSTALPDPD